MRKLFGHLQIKPAVLIIVVLIFLIGGCTAPKGEGFAIYLTKEDIPPKK